MKNLLFVCILFFVSCSQNKNEEEKKLKADNWVKLQLDSVMKTPETTDELFHELMRGYKEQGDTEWVKNIISNLHDQAFIDDLTIEYEKFRLENNHSDAYVYSAIISYAYLQKGNSESFKWWSQRTLNESDLMNKPYERLTDSLMREVEKSH